MFALTAIRTMPMSFLIMKKLLTLLIFTAFAISPAFANDDAEDVETFTYCEWSEEKGTSCREITDEEAIRIGAETSCEEECDEGD